MSLGQIGPHILAFRALAEALDAEVEEADNTDQTRDCLGALSVALNLAAQDLENRKKELDENFGPGRMA